MCMCMCITHIISHDDVAISSDRCVCVLLYTHTNTHTYTHAHAHTTHTHKSGRALPRSAAIREIRVLQRRRRRYSFDFFMFF